jgi:SAM-dependent methyltransferase
MTLVDLSPEMLAVSRELNPDCAHQQGDMRTVRLEQQFDGVLVHDAVMYMLTEADLAAAFRTAWEHCRPGGAAIFVPDCTRETFVPQTDHGGHDGELRSLRYLEWSYDPDPSDDTYVTDYVYLLRTGQLDVQVVFDRHLEGVFSRQVWLSLLAETGFDAGMLTDAYGRDVFTARRSAQQTGNDQ